MRQDNVNLSSRRWFWLGIGIAFLVAASLHQLFADAFPMTPDEGIHLLWIRMIEAGYTPYTQVYITYPPLYHLFLLGSWNLWPTMEGLRWFTLAYTFPAAILSALIARRIAGNVAGIATAFLFTLAPQFVADSRAILGELPSVTWALLAVWLAYVYRDTGRRPLLAVSGLALACSLLTKVLSPFAIVLVLLIVLSRYFTLRPLSGLPNQWRTHRRAILSDLLWWLGACSVPFVVTLILVDWRPLVDQVVGQRLAARVAYVTIDEYWIHRALLPIQYLVENLWLIPLAILGFAATLIHRQKYRFTLAVWFAMAIVMLFLHDPVRHKHLIILLPVLTIWAGLAVEQAWEAIVHPRRTSTLVRMTGALGALLVLAYCVRLPAIVQGWQASIAPPGVSEYEKPALEFIKKVTAPGDCIITDDMPLAYWSGRLVPPELVEVSENRLISGQLTMEQLTAITGRYDCQVVGAVANRINEYLPDYEEWVRRDYLGKFHFGEDDLFLAKSSTVPRPDYPLQAQFGQAIGLLGYSLDVQSAAPGARLPLVLYWKALYRPLADYTIFVHVRDAGNAIVVAADHRPYEGAVPTMKWKPGALVKDVVWLTLPPEVPPGEYSLWVGMYRVDTMERLPLQGDTSGENALFLGHIQVLPEP